ncbi:hypothetical protein [Streptomyces xinghaiensis]|uniref:hypothetical protein n=1 Tax=Streptomyces xinghaiensis TaxID=1038928 RepID=UPI000BB0C3E8|nr:hypothetical protein [Streptomyces xinghaiensis]
MTTRFDDGPEPEPPFEPDDPLAVILRPASDRLGPPPGRYEAIRRAASRRRLLRTAAGAGLSAAVAALVALPFYLASPGAPATPTVPQAPPPTHGRVTPSTPPAEPTPSTAPETPGLVPSGSPRPEESRPPTGPGTATREPADTWATPTPTEPPANRTGTSAATPGGQAPP